MNKLDLSGLLPVVAEKASPMLNDMLALHAANIHSIHIVGSAVLPDYNEKVSDVNSVVMLQKLDFAVHRNLLSRLRDSTTNSSEVMHLSVFRIFPRTVHEDP